MWGLSTISFLITLLTPYTSLGCQFQTKGCVKIEGKQVVFPNITYEGFVLLNGNLQLSKTNTCMFAVLNLFCLWANGSPRDLKYFQDSPADLKYFYDSHGDSKYVEIFRLTWWFEICGSELWQTLAHFWRLQLQTFPRLSILFTKQSVFMWIQVLPTKF